MACSDADPKELTRLERAVVVDSDDRIDWYSVPDEQIRSRLADTSVGLFYSNRLRLGATDAQLMAPTLGSSVHLCESERFVDQPSGAYCSGVLIDDDLVLTAGHCLGPSRESALDRCERIRVGFGYLLRAPDAPVTIDPADVYTCRRVVAYGIPTSGSSDDYAIVQLDRAVGARQAPAVVSDHAVGVGDLAVLANHGAGLPLKIERAAAVSAVLPDGSFIVAADTFAGASGGGMFDAELALTGFHVGGGTDYRWLNDCAVASVVDTSEEHFRSALVPVAALCMSGWPSRRLCGKSPICGDGVCSAEERATCQRDCPSQRCGDGLCEFAERGACAEDCEPFAQVPSTWADDPADYPGARLPPMAESPSCAVGGAGTSEADGGHQTFLFSGWLLAAHAACWGRRRARSATVKRAGPLR